MAPCQRRVTQLHSLNAGCYPLSQRLDRGSLQAVRVSATPEAPAAAQQAAVLSEQKDPVTPELAPATCKVVGKTDIDDAYPGSCAPLCEIERRQHLLDLNILYTVIPLSIKASAAASRCDAIAQAAFVKNIVLYLNRKQSMCLSSSAVKRSHSCAPLMQEPERRFDDITKLCAMVFKVCTSMYK